MVILRTRNKITDFLMILAWASPFNYNVIGKAPFNGVDAFKERNELTSDPSSFYGQTQRIDVMVIRDCMNIPKYTLIG